MSSVEGKLTVNGTEVPLIYAAARIHDNAEGLLDFPRELRILLADRKAPTDALSGVNFLPAEEMARNGALRGILITLNPADPKRCFVTLLSRPSRPGQSLLRQTISSTSEEFIKEWQLSPKQVSGAIQHEKEGDEETPDFPSFSYQARFTAPITPEPKVTADLKGKRARSSPQLQALKAKAKALIRGDFAAAKQLSTPAAARQIDMLLKLRPADSKQGAKQGGQGMLAMIPKVRRLIVRGNRAVALFPENSWSTFERIGGRWRCGD